MPWGGKQMKNSFEVLVDRVADRVSGRQPWKDILEDEPDLTIEEAYRIQFGLMKRLVAEGDAIVGYKAAYTTLAMQQQKGSGAGGPIAGAILRSANVPEGQPIRFVPNSRNAVEAEVAILLKQDLQGPNVTATDAMRATAGLLPAIEVAVGPPGGGERSRQMVIATHKTLGCIIVGGPLHSPRDLDLRLEGMVMEINGKIRGSATAVEVMGNPFNSVAFIANMAAANGERLRAGMILMTGSIIASIPVSAGDDVRIQFTRLGTIVARFVA
jgi:2-keto-4-pentenoate hydratase